VRESGDQCESCPFVSKDGCCWVYFWGVRMTAVDISGVALEKFATGALLVAEM
jgi:hypothetical protein